MLISRCCAQGGNKFSACAVMHDRNKRKLKYTESGSPDVSVWFHC